MAEREIERPTPEAYYAGHGGWARVESPPGRPVPGQVIPPGHMLYVRFGFTAGNAERLVPLETYLLRRDGGPITAGAWSRVKLGQIEQVANRPDFGKALQDRLGWAGPLLRQAAAAFTDTTPMLDGRADSWVSAMIRSQNDPSAPSVPDLPWWDRGAPSETTTWVRYEVDATLPMESKGSPEFYEAVAEKYRDLLTVTTGPAARIADVNGVPVTTAHYWIRQAREMGFLAAGRRGRAG